ncbi:hypothetical protein [Peptoniphilus porci]|uniref:Uncharacterized protein n=1 Tax=Peptoniphilus porci TaxID=2652280 RepID=A0A1U7LXK2_9FIRM|nr:hypothetical protein [Peptoniphilus porci]OLR61665.1 hypothetical protein BIV18_09945 [Peptoniphilus porci]
MLNNFITYDTGISEENKKELKSFLNSITNNYIVDLQENIIDKINFTAKREGISKKEAWEKLKTETLIGAKFGTYDIKFAGIVTIQKGRFYFLTDNYTIVNRYLDKNNIKKVGGLSTIYGLVSLEEDFAILVESIDEYFEYDYKEENLG